MSEEGSMIYESCNMMMGSCVGSMMTSQEDSKSEVRVRLKWTALASALPVVDQACCNLQEITSPIVIYFSYM